jgi:hypothetical protein
MEKSVVDAFTEECVDGWGDYSLSSFDELKPSARLLRKILHRIVPVGRQKEQATRFFALPRKERGYHMHHRNRNNSTSS